MYSIEAKLRIVTPAFLGGADPTRTAELRVPSIKGQLRFWYRATDPDFRRNEQRLFGSTDAGQSSFLLVLEGGQPDPSFIQATGESWVLPAGSRLVMKSDTGYEVRHNLPATTDWSPIMDFLARFDTLPGIRTV